MYLDRFAIIVLASIIVTACGGGSGNSSVAVGGAPPPPTATAPPYAISPAVLKASYVAGYPVQVTLSAKQTIPYAGTAFLKILVGQAPLDPSITITPVFDNTFTVKANTAFSAKPGHYVGDINISVCADAGCASHLPGSPFKLPYDIEVISPTGGVTTYNASSISALADAPDWETFQGNAQHTGYVPVSLDPSAFNRRWTWAASALQGVVLRPSTIATGGGMLFVSTALNFNSRGNSITAYRESDGSKVWSYSFDGLSLPQANPPAYAGGRVFVAAGAQGTTMFAFDGASGTLLFKAAMNSQLQHYLAPTVFNGRLYNDGGMYDGLYSFNAISGGLKFFTNLAQYDGWTPAVDANNLYAFTGNVLHMIDPVTGVERGKITAPYPAPYIGSTPGAPIIGAGGMVYAGKSTSQSNTIVAFDTVAMKVRWSASGVSPGNSAYADGLLYIANNTSGMLEVRQESDGLLSWSWTAPPGDQKFISDVLVTKNLVFVSTDRTTYAIDRSSRKTVWSEPTGGMLALSANCVLYIKGDMSILAINLK